MKAIYLNVQENKEPEVIDIEDDLDTFYRLIACSCIDITRRTIGDIDFNIICDDEGFLKPNPKISAIDKKGRFMLVGNLIIVSANVTDDGELTGLDNKEIEHLMTFIEKYYTYNYIQGYYILTDCEY